MSVQEAGSIVLDGPGWGVPDGRTLVFRSPSAVLTTCDVGNVEALLRQAEEAVGEGMYAAGYLAYEAGWAFAPVPYPLPEESRQPVLWLGLYDTLHEMSAVNALAGDHSHDAFRLRPGSMNWSRDEHAEAVDRVKHHIREGDAYQINLTQAFRFGLRGSRAALYRALRERQSAGFRAWVDTGERQVLSLSPELFFERSGDLLRARPMKGTAHRAPTDTAHEGRWLALDAKNRSENLMIVDLLRNDLSVCCLPGSVRVTDLFRVEAYETLYQMTSQIEGRLRPGTTNPDIFRALFPCGSVTGAPKIRAMQLISEIERRPRGVYCGAIGFMAPGGRSVFSVAIRTAEIDAGGTEATIGTGSGIVWDSDSGSEYDECQLKLKFLTDLLP